VTKTDHAVMKISESRDAVRISAKLLRSVRMVISHAMVYERLLSCGRKMGITGEVGEVLACHKLNLRLAKHPRCAGFDALDNKDQRIQIKTRRGERETGRLPAGRMGVFSKHTCDYAILVLLDASYEISEMWRLSGKDLKKLLRGNKRRDPNICEFKRGATRIWAAP
jgi:hypothetical protein